MENVVVNEVKSALEGCKLDVALGTLRIYASIKSGVAATATATASDDAGDDDEATESDRPTKRARTVQDADAGAESWICQILLTQVTSDGEAAVAGLQAHEYASKGLAYLQYVDSTGFCTPRQHQRQLTQALVRGYMASLVKRGGFSTCHLFATSHPEYLFRLSEKNARKSSQRATGTQAHLNAKLASWWADTIRHCGDSVKSVHVHTIGGDGAAPAASVMSKLDPAKYAKELPYPADATVASHLPIFPDDVKARTLASNPTLSSAKLSSFFAFMDAGLEGQNRPSIFMIQLVQQQQTLDALQPKLIFEDLFSARPREPLLDYSSLDKAIASTKQQLAAVNPASASVVCTAPSSDAAAAASVSASTSAAPTVTVVNVLGVRRKKAN